MARKHWKQRSGKSSAISERHFRRRLFERYGLAISTEEYHQLARDIQNGRGRMLFRESLTRTHWLLRFGETAVRVVYDKTVKAVATALPLETAQRDSDNTEAPKNGHRLTNYGQARDSDGTATAALCEDIAVPKDCQARAVRHRQAHPCYQEQD